MECLANSKISKLSRVKIMTDICLFEMGFRILVVIRKRTKLRRASNSSVDRHTSEIMQVET
jgi:hypothetical protein